MSTCTQSTATYMYHASIQSLDAHMSVAFISLYKFNVEQGLSGRGVGVSMGLLPLINHEGSPSRLANVDGFVNSITSSDLCCTCSLDLEVWNFANMCDSRCEPRVSASCSLFAQNIA